MGSRRIASSDMEGCTSGISHKVTTALCEETSQTEQTKGLVSGRQILRQAGRQADKHSNARFGHRCSDRHPATGRQPTCGRSKTQVFACDYSHHISPWLDHS